MAVHPRGLGKGLGALLRDVAETPQNAPGVRLIPLSDIVPNPHQPRQHFSEDSLSELAQSIRTQGVLQPVLVRPGKNGGFELIAGERRLRASRLAELEEIPALVREISDEESMAIALIENLQREDLGPVEESRALAALKQQLRISQEELAQKVGKSRPAVANALRLLQLPESVLEQLQNNMITSGHARAILGVSDPAAQEEMCARILDKGLNVRQAEQIAATYKERGTFSSGKSTTCPPADRSFFQSLRKQARKRFPCPAQFRGSREKGTITLRYRNAEELRLLLKQFELDDPGA
ncbi:MAG: ParB/RepB/Spo0J family partition protein [Desulfovibrionales bacterium]